MKVRAIETGHLSRPQEVIRNGKAMLADYILLGDVFEWEGEPHGWMEHIPNAGKPVKQEPKKPDMKEANTAEAPKTYADVMEQSQNGLAVSPGAAAGRDAIKAELDARGITYFKGASTDALFAVLAEAKKQEAGNK